MLSQMPHIFHEASGAVLYIYIYIYIYIYVRYTVLFCDGVRRLGIGNTEESNNKSTESIRTETDSKAMRKRSKYSKAQVNET